MANPVNPANTNNVTVLPAAGRAQASEPGAAGQSQAPAGRQAAAGGGSSAPPAAPVGQVTEAARDVSEFIQTVNRSLQISVDQDLGMTIITVVDSETDEVIRQIPQEELVELSRFIAERRAELEAGDAPVRGMLMDREG